MRKLLIIIFIFSIIFSYYFKLFDRFTFFLIQERQQGFLHYKIARNIESNSEGDTIKNLNEWMSNNFMTIDIDEEYLKILDKSSYFRLLDGYSACDGAADTYLRIAEFLKFKGYAVPLYDKNGGSPHTIVTLIPNNLFKENSTILNFDNNFEFIKSNSIVIDPTFNVSFLKKENYASINDICTNDYNENIKSFFKYKGYVDSNFFCLTNHISIENQPLNQARLLKKIYYLSLDIIPEILLFKMYENYINQKYGSENYFVKARHHHLFGNYKLAKKYYKLSIEKETIEQYDLFRGASGIEKDNWQQYIDNIKKFNLANYAIFFLTIIENNQKNVIKANPFKVKSRPFYYLYESYYKKKLNHFRNINNF